MRTCSVSSTSAGDADELNFGLPAFGLSAIARRLEPWQRLEARLARPYTGSMHVHVHGAGGPTRVLKISLAVTLGYIVLLVVAGIRAHSLALLSEAGHNLSDFLALLLSLVAVYFQSRPASSTKTYGYHRAGVLAALVNATSLVAVSGFIFYEAFRRLQHPQPVQAEPDDVGGCGRRGDERQRSRCCCTVQPGARGGQAAT